MRRCVFLDRDGTLVRDVGYPHRLGDYELLPGVLEGLTLLREAGFRLVIVTNQSGLGRGIFDAEAFERFHGRLLDDLARAGIAIERTYVCPHHPESGCRCRKPRPGLLERAHTELGADLARSWVVGDAESDVELARAAGCRGAVRLIDRAAESAPRPPPAPAPEQAAASGALLCLEARDLLEAAERILEAERAAGPC